MQEINEKILGRLQLYQQVYHEDYKEQVKIMSEELKKLKANLDAEVLYNKCTPLFIQPAIECIFWRKREISFERRS